MGKETTIGWCDHTFNTWWGCVEAGPECDNCYARSFDKRVGRADWGHAAPRRFFSDLHWKEPLTWNRKAERDGVRRRVFCGSMMDIAERRNDAVGRTMDSERATLRHIVEKTPHLDWLFLTKRPQNYTSVFPWWVGGCPQNVWLGCTAGNQEQWDKRVKHLIRANQQIGAPVAFVSVEPMLGPIDVASDLNLLSWIIIGGESGPKRRPFSLMWLTNLVVQCQSWDVPCYVKQDAHKSPGQQGRIPDELWRLKEHPPVVTGS